MATTVVRVYETEQQAAEAVRKLEEAGFASDILLHVTPAAGDADARAVALEQPRLRDFVAEQVARERSVVAVRPLFGQGKRVTWILDQAGPIAVAAPAPEAAATRTSSRAAPLSDLFGWPVLTQNPTPLSDKFGWRVLSKTAAPLSDKFGWRTHAQKTHFMTSKLSNNPAPFSSSLGMGLLSGKAAPLSDKFGWATRSEKTHFMTSELSNEPTPLSSRLGLPVLTGKR